MGWKCDARQKNLELEVINCRILTRSGFWLSSIIDAFAIWRCVLSNQSEFILLKRQLVSSAQFLKRNVIILLIRKLLQFLRRNIGWKFDQITFLSLTLCRRFKSCSIGISLFGQKVSMPLKNRRLRTWVARHTWKIIVFLVLNCLLPEVCEGVSVASLIK